MICPGSTRIPLGRVIVSRAAANIAAPLTQ